MKYQVYKLKFNTAVHFGKRRLEDGENSFSADVLFSALCHEAVQQYGEKGIEDLLDLVRNKKVRLTDAFPYHLQELYVPKPMLQIERSEEEDSSEKKLYKKLNYIKWDQMESYIADRFDIKEELAILKQMGKGEVRTRASVMEEADAMPFSVGTYSFNKGWGLYFLLAYEKDEDKAYIEDLLLALELAGIGGKRSSGLGRFTLDYGMMPERLALMLCENEHTGHYMALTTCMEDVERLHSILENAQYSLIRKSGFVASDSYADGIYRKKDFFMFKAGSTFVRQFTGIVEDVSGEGNHPVYRYGMPIFMGVK